MFFFAFTLHHCLFLSTQKVFFPYLFIKSMFIDTHLISRWVLLYTQSQLLGRFRCFPELCRKDPKSCDCFTPGIFCLHLSNQRRHLILFFTADFFDNSYTIFLFLCFISTKVDTFPFHFSKHKVHEYSIFKAIFSLCFIFNRLYCTVWFV